MSFSSADEGASRAALTVLIMAWNEEESLTHLLPAIKRSLEDFEGPCEILVMDGGSTDGTGAIAREEGARFIRQQGPGFGGALREGIAAARGEYILTMDADGSHPAAMIPSMWSYREGKDLVIASRYVPGGSADMPRDRYWLSWILNLVTRLWFGFKVLDSSGGLKLYRAEALRKVHFQNNDFSVQQEILALLLSQGGRVAEIPFHYEPRVGGRSKAKVWALGKSYLRLFWRLRGLRLPAQEKYSGSSA